jgi:hypothetical protein
MAIMPKWLTYLLLVLAGAFVVATLVYGTFILAQFGSARC